MQSTEGVRMLGLATRQLSKAKVSENVVLHNPSVFGALLLISTSYGVAGGVTRSGNSQYI